MELSLLAYGAAGVAFLTALFQLINQKPLEKYAVGQGMLSADRSTKLSTFFLLVCGAACLFAEVQVYGMYALAGFMLLSAFLIHKFWDEPDKATRFTEGLQFVKNLMIAGLLICMAIIVEQA
ncbi:MAG: hypothetical protein R3301_03825 [Saprospiraceae bacterium]|nr:hypothetical protein [Saprospiraceae bacterium]